MSASRRVPVLVAVAGALLGGCGTRQAGAPRTLSGRALFVSEGCGHCHALAAAGTHGRVGPDFDTAERLGRQQLRAALTEGVNGMPSYESLDPAKLYAIASAATPPRSCRSRPKR